MNFDNESHYERVKRMQADILYGGTSNVTTAADVEGDVQRRVEQAHDLDADIDPKLVERFVGTTATVQDIDIC